MRWRFVRPPSAAGPRRCGSGSASAVPAFRQMAQHLTYFPDCLLQMIRAMV